MSNLYILVDELCPDGVDERRQPDQRQAGAEPRRPAGRAAHRPERHRHQHGRQDGMDGLVEDGAGHPERKGKQEDGHQQAVHGAQAGEQHTGAIPPDGRAELRYEGLDVGHGSGI